MTDRKLMQHALEALDRVISHAQEAEDILLAALSEGTEQPQRTHWEGCELQEAKEAATKAERDRIVNLLMIQHEAAKGAHNYWHRAALLIQADVASDT